MTPCPYCATALFESAPVVQCKGCGSPVALTAERKKIKKMINQVTVQERDTKARKLYKSALKFPKLHDVKEAVNE
jgi:uncharacterized Zn finger protein (UPF0148 family)